ncbi:MAG: aminoglycoside phosphotransferase family protein [Armatimonadota bacterium]
MEESPTTIAVSDEQLNEFLSAAFGSRPGWVIGKREPIGSYQQHLERIRLDWPERTYPVAEGGKDEVSGSEDSETVFLRVYQGFMSWWTLATPDLPQREQTAWRVAARAGIPVPDTLWTVELPEIAAAVQRLSPGQAVAALPMTDALEASLGQMLARLHRAQVETVDLGHLPDIRLAALFPRLLAWAEEADATELLESAKRLQKQFGEEIVEQPPVFLHGDFHRGNVLADGDEVTAVIDWEEAAYGDPRLDICVMEMVLRRRADGGKVFVAAYEAASGLAAGPLKPWEELCEVRNRIVGAWVKGRVAKGHSLPTARPEAWFM